MKKKKRRGQEILVEEIVRVSLSPMMETCALNQEFQKSGTQSKLKTEFQGS